MKVSFREMAHLIARNPLRDSTVIAHYYRKYAGLFNFVLPFNHLLQNKIKNRKCVMCCLVYNDATRCERQPWRIKVH